MRKRTKKSIYHKAGFFLGGPSSEAFLLFWVAGSSSDADAWIPTK